MAPFTGSRFEDQQPEHVHTAAPSAGQDAEEQSRDIAVRPISGVTLPW